MSRSSVVLAFAPLVALALGCGSDAPKFPRVGVDSGVECVVGAPPAPGPEPAEDGGMDGGGATAPPPAEPAGCPAGQICLNGRCFTGCTGDAQCARGEMCSAEGVCVVRTMPAPDVGPPVDSGPANPCDGVTCEAPTPACHPETGACVECQDFATQCSPATGAPICDVAAGRCRAFASGACAPCNIDLDCSGVGTCVTRDDPYEKVCLPACDADAGTCPPGMECDAGVCLPKIGSCTSFFAASTSQGCLADAECAPLGTTPAAGTCDGLDADAGVSGVCRQPCGADDQCPSGLLCADGTFCRPAI